MTDHAPLPTFRALLSAAVALHLAAVPTDGSAMVLDDIATATPMLDAAVVPLLQRAQTCIDGAVAALTGLPKAAGAERLGQCHVVRHAYHVALMAYLGVEVA